MPIPTENAEGLRAAVLTVADLVIADATPTKSKRHAKPFAPSSPHTDAAGGGSSCGALAAELDGAAYLQIRAAFSAAFEQLERQPAPAPNQVHELWATAVDYMDRLVARANMALTAADCLQKANLELEEHICQLATRCGELRGETGRRLGAQSLAAAQLKDVRMSQAAAEASKGKAAAHADLAPPAHAAAAAVPGAQQQGAAGDLGRPRSTAAGARLERAASAKSIALRLAAQDAGPPAGARRPADALHHAPQPQPAVCQAPRVDGMVPQLEQELAGLHAQAGATRQRRLGRGARPQSIAERASLSVWGRYVDRSEVGQGRATTAQRSASEALPQASRAASLRHSLPELALPLLAATPRVDPACSPLADGLLASARSGPARPDAAFSCYHTADSEVNAVMTGASQSAAPTQAAGRLRSSVPVHALLLSAARLPSADDLASARSGASTGRAREDMTVLRRSLALGASPLRAPQTARELRPAARGWFPASSDASARTKLLRASPPTARASFPPAPSRPGDAASPGPASPTRTPLLAARASTPCPTTVAQGAFITPSPIRGVEQSPDVFHTPFSSVGEEASSRFSSGGSGSGRSSSIYAQASLADWGRPGSAHGARRAASPPPAQPLPAMVVHSPTWSFPLDPSPPSPRQLPGSRRPPSSPPATPFLTGAAGKQAQEGSSTAVPSVPSSHAPQAAAGSAVAVTARDVGSNPPNAALQKMQDAALGRAASGHAGQLSNLPTASMTGLAHASQPDNGEASAAAPASTTGVSAFQSATSQASSPPTTQQLDRSQFADVSTPVPGSKTRGAPVAQQPAEPAAVRPPRTAFSQPAPADNAVQPASATANGQLGAGLAGSREAALTPAAAHAFGRYQQSAAAAAQQAAAADKAAPITTAHTQLTEASSEEEDHPAGSDAGEDPGWASDAASSAGAGARCGSDSASEARDSSMTDGAQPCDPEEGQADVAGPEGDDDDGAESEASSPGVGAREMSEGLLRTAPDLDVEDPLGACLPALGAAGGGAWAGGAHSAMAVTTTPAAQAQFDGAAKTSRMAFAQPSADAELPATLFDNPTAADLGALFLLPEGLLDGPAAAQAEGMVGPDELTFEKEDAQPLRHPATTAKGRKGNRRASKR